MFGSMMRGEIFRLRYRRRAWGSMILMLLAGVVATASWLGTIAMPSKIDRAIAAEQLARMQESGDCIGCTVRDLLGWPTFEDIVSSGIAVAAPAFAFLTFMIVVTYVGADFSSGAVSTQLTFTPRRVLVLATRALASGILGALLMSVAMLTTTGITIVGYLATNGIESIGPASGLLRVLAGAIAYGALLGVIAALVTFIVPSTPLAMGATVVVLIGDLFLSQQVTHPPEWLYQMMATHNGLALISSGWSTSVEVGEAVAYHLIVIAVLFTIGAIVFERRDIKA